MKTYPVYLILLLGLFGCASGTVLLRNDTGETVKCEGNADVVDACVKKSEAAGYKRIEEPQMMPMGRLGY